MENKIKVSDADIIVLQCSRKPYYAIKYKEVGDEYYKVGYGSYFLNNVRSRLDAYFVLEENENNMDEEHNKDAGKETNDTQMLLEHIEALEGANALILNSFGAIFSLLLERKDSLHLPDIDCEMLEFGVMALESTVSELIAKRC